MTYRDRSKTKVKTKNVKSRYITNRTNGTSFGFSESSIVGENDGAVDGTNDVSFPNDDDDTFAGICAMVCMNRSTCSIMLMIDVSLNLK